MQGHLSVPSHFLISCINSWVSDLQECRDAKQQLLRTSRQLLTRVAGHVMSALRASGLPCNGSSSVRLRDCVSQQEARTQQLPHLDALLQQAPGQPKGLQRLPAPQRT